jgi:Reverse transcriptase (RNA-dependent DNA polymerase)
MWEFDKEVYTLFVDFEKAYDSIHRSTLFNILKEFNVSKKLINLIKATMENSEIKIKIANSTSKSFKVTSGLRQGDALSPILFNLVLEKVVRDMNISEGITLGQSKIGLLAYADDIAIIGDNIEIVKIHCKKLMDAASKVGLRINDKKTEFMKLNRRDRTYRHGESMNVDGHIFHRVPQFKYLGVLLTQDNELKVEISKRIQLANNCYFGMGTLLKSRSISLNLKIKIYMTLIRPVILYGSETWASRKIEEIRLDTFERKVLRRIYGPCLDSRTEEWRIRTNEELQNLFQRPCISREVAKRRLMWAGHAWRKKDAMINTVIREEPKGKRPLGRPRLRWEDCVKREVKEVDPRANWREIAENRIRWREICFTGWS